MKIDYKIITSLDDKDRKMIQFIYEQGLATADQLSFHVSGLSSRSIYHKIWKLRKFGLLSNDIRINMERPVFVTETGAAFIKQIGLSARHLHGKYRVNIGEYFHSSKLNWIRIAFERAGWAWVSEKLLLANPYDLTHSPDGLIQKDGMKHFVELKNIFPSPSSLTKQILTHLSHAQDMGVGSYVILLTEKVECRERRKIWFERILDRVREKAILEEGVPTDKIVWGWEDDVRGQGLSAPCWVGKEERTLSEALYG